MLEDPLRITLDADSANECKKRCENAARQGTGVLEMRVRIFECQHEVVLAWRIEDRPHIHPSADVRRIACAVLENRVLGQGKRT